MGANEFERPELEPPPASRLPVDKIIVAIHGIGSQQRSETIRSVAQRFGSWLTPPLPVMPLGFFRIGPDAKVKASLLEVPAGHPLARVGFAEVFWADIPRKVVSEGDTLEETKAWAGSVVSRARAMYLSRVAGGKLDADDFQLAADAVGEVVETIAVLENLLKVLGKMGIFRFELAPLLRDYIGDVQIVTEFEPYRDEIVARFHGAMAQILGSFNTPQGGQKPEIFVVAHSEGTVISFLGLLQALSGRQVVGSDGQAISLDWIENVRGFMTIGSPIDKHLVLWPKLWSQLDLESRVDPAQRVVFGPEARPRLVLPQRIRWRNYYDFGDPIGFQLDTAVKYLEDQECAAFEFETEKHDLGFSRYVLPGKAHNGYWGDPEVFGHFIDDVVSPDPSKPPARAPKSKLWVRVLSHLIPYVLTALLHFVAVFILFKGGKAFEAGDGALKGQILLLSLLLLGVTVSARLPRLVKTEGWRWQLAAVLAFLVAAVPSLLWLDGTGLELFGPTFSSFAGGIFAPIVAMGSQSEKSSAAGMVLGAVLVVILSWLLPRRWRVRPGWLVSSGMVIVGWVVLQRLDKQIWTVLLSGLAFMYLWWLGILLFDLTFIWHRYIRRSVAVKTLSDWHRGRDAEPTFPRWPSKKSAGKK